MTDLVAVRLAIHGHVQGVFFRAHVAAAARRAGASGWAENRPDGTVEVHAEGTPQQVDAVERAARAGSPASHVVSVERTAVEPAGLDGFGTR